MSQHNIIFIPGFGFQASIGQGIAPNLILFDHANYQSLKELLAALNQISTAQTSIIGWSLGGVIATHFAQQYPTNLRQVMLTATSLRFYHPDFAAFCHNIKENLPGTLKKFALMLAQQDRMQYKLLLPHLLKEYDDNILQWQLELLHSYDLTKLFPLKTSSYLIRAEDDTLMPSDTQTILKSLTKIKKVYTIAGRSHVPFLQQHAEFTRILTAILNEE